MIIIGEKINGAIPSVKKAIEERDEGFIRDLALRQRDAGADYIDVCAGTSTDKEYDALCWLIRVVQETVETPLCLDSPDPRMLERILPLVKKNGILNSVSGEGEKCAILYPLLKGSTWKVIALTCDDAGIASDPARKSAIAQTLIEKADAYSIAQDRLFIDPVVLALSAVNSALITFMEAVRSIKAAFPLVHITSGLSNISFGMPCRKLINQSFLALAMSAGMDSAIIDPTNRETAATILAVEVLLGKDAFCRRYNVAYRKGLLGEQKKPAGI